jgi:hypothetical protein
MAKTQMYHREKYLIIWVVFLIVVFFTVLTLIILGIDNQAEESGIDIIKILDTKAGITAYQICGHIFITSDKYLYKITEVKE